MPIGFDENKEFGDLESEFNGGPPRGSKDVRGEGTVGEMETLIGRLFESYKKVPNDPRELLEIRANLEMARDKFWPTSLHYIDITKKIDTFFDQAECMQPLKKAAKKKGVSLLSDNFFKGASGELCSLKHDVENMKKHAEMKEGRTWSDLSGCQGYIKKDPDLSDKDMVERKQSKLLECFGVEDRSELSKDVQQLFNDADTYKKELTIILNAAPMPTEGELSKKSDQLMDKVREISTDMSTHMKLDKISVEKKNEIDKKIEEIGYEFLTLGSGYSLINKFRSKELTGLIVDMQMQKIALENKFRLQPTSTMYPEGKVQRSTPAWRQHGPVAMAPAIIRDDRDNFAQQPSSQEQNTGSKCYCGKNQEKFVTYVSHREGGGQAPRIELSVVDEDTLTKAVELAKEKGWKSVRLENVTLDPEQQKAFSGLCNKNGLTIVDKNPQPTSPSLNS